MKCPCCNQPISNLPATALAKIEMPLIPGLIVKALCDAFPGSVTSNALIFQIYQGVDEPENAMTGISVQMNHVRRHIEPYGWTVPRRKPGRGRPTGYRLEPMT